jgi:hypothetical protein
LSGCRFSKNYFTRGTNGMALCCSPDAWVVTTAVRVPHCFTFN